MADSTTEEFIRKARLVHGDKYDYSKVEYVNSKTKVCIICPIHGEFWQIPNSHLTGRGCKQCGFETRNKKNRITRIQFIEKAQKKHGDKYDYSLISDDNYIDTKYDVPIVCQTHGLFFQTPNSHLCGSGCPVCANNKRNENRKGRGRFDIRGKIFNIGINDYDGSITGLVSYHRWINMLTRCYSNDYHSKKPTYSHCTMCKEWLYFSNFKKWFDANYVDGYVIDKDILVKGNKVYSPETCCFVPAALNSLLTKRDFHRGSYPIGIQKPQRGRFLASIRINNKPTKIGRFDTIEEAFAAYKQAKEKHIKEVAQSYFDKGEITERVYDALMKYEVEITD